MRTKLRAVIASAIFLALAVGTVLFGAPPASAQTPDAAIGGTVTDGSQPVDGVSVDLFSADTEGNRLTWLESVATGHVGSGSFQFDVSSGCYAVTAIAPEGRQFTDGSRWATTTPVCVEAGETVSTVDATLGTADTSALVTGKVQFENGDAIDGIPVDLFTAAADGSRGDFLRTARTEISGEDWTFSFSVEPGCYVLTFHTDISGFSFAPNGNRWTNRSFCVTAGERLDGLDATLITSSSTRVGGTVFQGTSRIGGVSVDLFQDDGSGGRGDFITSGQTTDGSGTIGFPTSPGCYILTFVAPTGDTWEENGGRWLNRGVCVEFGELAVADPAVLAQNTDRSIAIDVRITQDGSVVSGVGIDVFAAEADGSRGEFIGSETTVSTFATRVNIEPGDGCWFVTFVASDIDIFSETGTKWLNWSFCTNADQTLYAFEATIRARPSNEVLLALSDGPHRVQAEVTQDAGVSYVLSGTPGSQVAFEILDIDEDRCGTTVLTRIVKSGEDVISRHRGTGCSTEGPWTIPDNGTLSIGFLGRFGPVQFETLISEVAYEDIALDLTPGQPEVLTGTIETAREGVDYVVTAEPGQAVSIDLSGPTCDRQYGYITVHSLDSSEVIVEDGTGSDCRQYFLGEVPADGTIKLRVFQHQGPFALFPERQSYAITAWLIDYEQIVVEPGERTLEISDSIDYPFAGRDYIFDATSFELLNIKLLEPIEEGVCRGVGVVLRAEYFVDDEPVAGGHCDGISNQIDASEASSIRVRIHGEGEIWTFGGDGVVDVRPATGPFRFEIDQLVFGSAEVDLRDGPVNVTGSIDQLDDEVEYRLTAPPGSLVSAADVEQWSTGASCGFNGSLELKFDAFDSAGTPQYIGYTQECAREGPWVVPDDGILILQASAQQRETGSYNYTFSSFADRQVAIDINAGPVWDSATINHPLEGTTYLISGQPGQLIEGEVTMLSPLSDNRDCETRVFSLKMEIFNDRGDVIGNEYVGYNGCIPYGDWEIPESGVLRVRVFTGGIGTEYQGSYTMNFREVAQ